MEKLVLILWLLLCSAFVFGQDRTVTGQVTDEQGIALAGASVVAGHQGTTTDSSGHFSLHVDSQRTVLVASFIGYLKREVPAGLEPMVISLLPDPNQLKEVVVSVGYQDIPKERATGSFVQIDNKLLNRSVSRDIISRLADVTPGLVFNRAVPAKPGAQTSISIRGQNTLFAREDPLIVLDNFPYEGDVSNINPNDIETVTILKDAAAASIWGAQSGNGVIVITTKKGKFNQPLHVSLNSNVTAGQRPDAFYMPKMSSSDYIDMELSLFAKGYYSALEKDVNKTALTPVVELMIAQRDGKVSAQQVSEQIQSFRSQDVRNDFSQYFTRKSISQQYALQLSGGSSKQRFFLSAGYDKSLFNEVGNSADRVSINANNTYSFLNQKLQLTSGLYFVSSLNRQNGMGLTSMQMAPGRDLYPYARLAAQDGSPLAVEHTYRTSFIEDAASKGLLDWNFYPLAEIRRNGNQTRLSDTRINMGLKYHLSAVLTADLLYQYTGSRTDASNHQSLDSWYTRDLINRFTVIGTDGLLKRPVPAAGILDANTGRSTNHFARLQLNLNKDFSSSNVTALAGAEVRDLHRTGLAARYYGYDDQLAISQQVDYLSYFTSYVNPSLRYNRIPDGSSMSDLTDRYVSYYANASYTYKGRYVVSASGRLDQSNLFGVKTNQKGVPLYSAGLSWKIHQERFYRWAAVPYLNVRATFGYNGNIDKTLSAFTTAGYVSAAAVTGLPYAWIKNPPNPQLRWERTRMANLGLDWKAKGARLGGSFEYFFKKGTDLIGNTPLAPQTGVSSFTGNSADTRGQGLDFTLNTINIQRALRWQTDFFLSYASDKVSRYLLKSSSVVGDYMISGGVMPTEGKPLYGLYSYRWAGLDPATGDPRGYLAGEVSTDYQAIKASATLDQLVFNGTLRPKVFGALRNTLTYKAVSLSANISYRLAYVVRTNSVNYNSVLTGNGGHGDYSQRWKKPGDEKSTHVPSMPAATNGLRDEFYALSNVLVERADHIRLQDVTLSYDISQKSWKKFPFENMHFYIYLNNLGILWKKSKKDFDPDYVLTPPVPRTLSAGLKLDF